VSGVQASFSIEPRRGMVLKGKASREGSLWTLTLPMYPSHTETGFDLVKAQKRLTQRIAKLLEQGS
jgi:hypothetical protein